MCCRMMRGHGDIMRNSSVCVFRDSYANYILWTMCAHVCELSGMNKEILRIQYGAVGRIIPVNNI